jgi:hypothetical protein
VYDYIVNQWGSPDVDLFASRLNHKVGQYFSWQPDPDCCGVDAFSVDWAQFGLAYAFPPFGLVGRVVNKALCERANLILVAPNWPSQHWFPVVHDSIICATIPLKNIQSGTNYNLPVLGLGENAKTVRTQTIRRCQTIFTEGLAKGTRSQ